MVEDLIAREEALELVRRHVKNSRLVKHMIAVSSIMKVLAKRLGGEPELWELVGLLHDIDYEEVREDMNRHGLVSAEIILDVLPKEALHAIRAHNERTGVKAENQLDIALIAADALSGLIVATALMMPDRGVATVKVSSLRRKFRDRSFARGVSRDRIRRCEELGLTLEEFFELGLKAMVDVSKQLGL